jgi:glucose-6-phosphate isomerase
MEGPFDKVVTFIRLEDHGVDVPVPNRTGLPEDLAYLSGHSLSQLLGAEQEATAAALARSGRMNGTITLPKVDADVLASC